MHRLNPRMKHVRAERKPRRLLAVAGWKDLRGDAARRSFLLRALAEAEIPKEDSAACDRHRRSRDVISPRSPERRIVSHKARGLEKPGEATLAPEADPPTQMSRRPQRNIVERLRDRPARRTSVGHANLA